MKDVNNAEFIQMMNRCKHEIIGMRATIDHLQPKAEAYDNMAAVLCLLPRQSVGMSEDIVWALNKRIEELTPKPANASEKVS